MTLKTDAMAALAKAGGTAASIPHREETFSRNVDWNLFRTFVQIVECGSISAAARTLNRQQPSISAALRRLEDHIGTELCTRAAGGVQVTPAGSSILEICRSLHRQVDRMPVEVAKARGVVDGVVLVRMVSDVVSPELDAALARFNGDFPGVELRLEVGPWRSIIRALLAGDAEIGVACDSAPTLDLQYVPLMRENQQLYCGSRHPRSGDPPRHPATFRDEAFVLTGQDEPDELAYFRRRYGLGGRGAGSTETLAEARRLIQSGVGVGFLPTGVAEAATASPLWPLLPADMLPGYDVYVVARPSDTLSDQARILFAYLRREAEARGAP